MSLYNTVNGCNQITFLLLPMLNKHPNDYPRFRDCFLNDEKHPEYKNHIHIYTRTGGANRKDFEEENQIIRDMDGFITDFDDYFDNTFSSWIFKVPEKWKFDFDLIITGQIEKVSIEYQNQLRKVFPKLSGTYDKIFKSSQKEK